MIDEVKTMLSQKFKMKDLGAISIFLGIDFKPVPGKIKMSQENYLSKVLERFGMTNCKPKPMPSKQKLIFSKCAEPFESKKYREAIGCPIYATTYTRPNVMGCHQVGSVFSEFCCCHWRAVKHVFRYLKGTLDYKLCFQKYEDCLTLTGFTDAVWGGSEDRSSTSGYCCLLNKNGPAISWKSRKQATVA